MTDQQSEKLRLIGPSFYGWTYRSASGPVCYRLLAIDTVQAQQRHEINNWIGKPPAPGLARITKAWQPHTDLGYFYVRYELEGIECTMTEVLASPDASLRLDFATRALRALPVWWQQLPRDHPLLPMPADIVYTSNGSPHLLSLPYWQLPGVEAIFAEPVRGLYLAPELVCARRSITWESVDRYALGVTLLQCFYHLPAVDDVEALLPRAANGTIFTPRKMRSKLPFWHERVEAAKQAMAIARRLVALNPGTREAVNLDILEQCSRRMDPLAAVAEKAIDRPDEAFLLVQDILLNQESYELLMMASELAWRRLNRPLEALDLYERAINLEAARPEAYDAQLQVIVAAGKLARLSQLVANNPAVGAQLDAKMWRDFQSLPPDLQLAREHEVADYLLWRQQYDAAAHFIYPRLFDNGTYVWWKFAMNLAYAEALMSQGKLTEAREQLSAVRRGLSQVISNQTFDAGEIHQHGQALVELEAKLMVLNQHPPR
jgi:hypothetical protein